jgi:hypothetical protein
MGSIMYCCRGNQRCRLVSLTLRRGRWRIASGAIESEGGFESEHHNDGRHHSRGRCRLRCV